MVDIDTIRVGNFTEALRQANRYLALGLFASLFLFALLVDPAAFTGSGSVSLPGGLPSLPIRHSQVALALIYWVAPVLADFSLARAERIALQLQEEKKEEILKAAATFPCIATTRVHGPRWIAALGPPLVVSIAGWMTGVFSFTSMRLILFSLAVLPYLILFAVRLRRSFGGLPPDSLGD